MISAVLFTAVAAASLWTLIAYDNAQRVLQRYPEALAVILGMLNAWLAILILMFVLWMLGLYAFQFGARFSILLAIAQTIISASFALHIRSYAQRSRYSHRLT